MKNLMLLTAMNTIVAGTLSAQANIPASTNWLALNHELLGTNTSASWLMDLDADGMELYRTEGQALIIVDRTPILNQDGAAFLRKPVLGLGGTSLSLVGDVHPVGQGSLRGTYSGLLGGTAVLMDQYVKLTNGVPTLIIRVVSRLNGSAPAGAVDTEALVLHLLQETPSQELSLSNR